MSEVLANGRYRVVRRIAQGGMGEVLLAEFSGDNNWGLTPGLLVVKRVLSAHPNKVHHAEMLREEGRVALRLLHHNLVETFLIDEHNGEPLLVMEFLSGRALSQVLGQAKKRKEMVPVEVALALVRSAACGLHFAHTLSDRGRPLGLIHRDVSPANLFITFDGRVKVIDFGVAKAKDSEIRTSTGILKGKLGYMSPEHALGEKLTPSADMWSLGVLFWETLCAERLFASSSPTATLRAIAEKPIPSPATLRPELPDQVVDVCMKLLTRDLDRRIRSGADLVRAIDRLPEASKLRTLDLGGWLSGRFPEEAQLGRDEAARASKMRRRTPVPIGLVEGTAHPQPSDEEAPTMVIGAQAALEAIDRLTQEEGEPGRSEEAPTIVMGAQAARQAITDAVREEDARRSGTENVPTKKLMKNLITDEPSEARKASPHTAMADPEALTLAISDLPEELSPVPRSSPPQTPLPAPMAISTRWRGGLLSTTVSVEKNVSWVAVACFTFGALALAMGIVFSFIAPAPPAPQRVYAYTEGNHEVIVALPAHAPETAKPRPVQIANPMLATTLEPGRFEAMLKESGVYARASLPSSHRGVLAALLPVLIAGFGVLALAGALPSLLLGSSRLRTLVQLLLFVGAGAGLVYLVKHGGLKWPGADAWKEQPRLIVK